MHNHWQREPLELKCVQLPGDAGRQNLNILCGSQGKDHEQRRFATEGARPDHET